MTRTSARAVALAAALMLVSCGPSGESAETLPAADRTPTTHECVIAGDLFRIPPDSDVSNFPDDWFVINTVGNLQERQGLARLVPDDIGERVLARGWYVDISAASPAISVLDVLSQFPDIGATPVHAVSFEGHWSLLPGAEPDNTGVILPKAARSFLQSRINAKVSRPDKVAIVDSGFPRLDGWQGLDIGLIAADRIDAAPSHGAFVTSILKQVSPGVDAAGAKAGFSANSYVDQSGKPFVFGSSVFSDELGVEIAIERLKQWANAEPTVLNMSLGTVACPGDGLVEPPFAIEKALADWPHLVSFAAAGNEQPHADNQFYPAAFSSVRGVAALNLASSVGSDSSLTATAQAIVWDSGKRITAATRPWVDHETLGVDVLGVGRADPSSWSGSSFATPVAVGLHLNDLHIAGVDGASLDMVEKLVPIAKAPAAGCQLMGLVTDGSGTQRFVDRVTQLWCSPDGERVGLEPVTATEPAQRGVSRPLGD